MSDEDLKDTNWHFTKMGSENRDLGPKIMVVGNRKIDVQLGAGMSY